MTIWIISLIACVTLGVIFGVMATIKGEWRLLGVGIAYATAACVTGILASHLL